MAFLQLVNKLKFEIHKLSTIYLQKRRYCKFVFELAFAEMFEIDRIPGCIERDEWSLSGAHLCCFPISADKEVNY